MNEALRVALSPAPRRAAVGLAAAPLLDAQGAAVVLGASPAPDGLATPVVPTPRTLFAPRGVCVAADGSLWVADTGHHRLLGWRHLPTEDAEPAAWLIGQASFGEEGRNGRTAPGAATLNVPTGIAACGAGLALADAWNHRVLIWHQVPRRSHQAADLVLGQPDFGSVESNRGAPNPRADTLFWPFGVAWDGARLWVADTGNRRVLIWNGLPVRSAQPADLVLGQSGFECRDENAGGEPTAASMRWPHGIAFLGAQVCVADAGNNRIMLWREAPRADGAACDLVLGQSHAAAVDHNRSDYWPGAATLNMPYALVAGGEWLVVADTANSRLVGWRRIDLLDSGVPARALAAQTDWSDKGENRWNAPTRDSLCWPYGLASTARYALIADAGNNRVLLWGWHRELLA